MELQTAEELYKILIRFVGMNQAFDLKNGEPDEAILKARGANYGLIRKAVIAGQFITDRGLDEEYKAFEAGVNLEVAKIAERANNAKG